MQTGLAARDQPENPLAGRMTALLDLCTRLPETLCYASAPQAHAQRFWEALWAVLKAGTLLIFDKGALNFAILINLSQAQGHFITRTKANLAYTLNAPCTAPPLCMMT